MLKFIHTNGTSLADWFVSARSATKIRLSWMTDRVALSFKSINYYLVG